MLTSVIKMMIFFYCSLLLFTGAEAQPEPPYNRLGLFPIFQPLTPWRCHDGVVAEVERVLFYGYVNLSGIKFDVTDGFLSLALLVRDESLTLFPTEDICIINLEGGCSMRQRDLACYCLSFSQDTAQLMFNVTLKWRYQYLHLGLMFVLELSEKPLLLSNAIDVPYIYNLPILLCVLFYIVERKQVESLARLRNVELPQQVIAKSTPGLSIIAYTPRCPALASMFQKAVKLNLVSSAVGFNSIDRGYKFTNDSAHRSPLVVFKGLDSTSTKVPRRLTFEVAVQQEIPAHVYVYGHSSGEPNSVRDYYTENVSLTQLRVAHVFINFWKDKNDTKIKTFELALKKIFSFHSKPFLDERARGFVLARFLFLLFFALILAATSAAVQERQLKLTEALRPMGISMDVYWLGWFTANFLMGCHLVFAATLLYSANMMPNILVHHASPLLLSGYMLLFLADFLTLAMLCSCFIKKVRLARVYMTIVILIAMDLGNFLESSMNHNLFTYVAGVLIFGIGHFIVQYKIQDNKRRAVVTDLSNLLESTPDRAGGHAVLDGLLLLVLNSLFNVALLWYLEQVYMADRGNSRPFYFLCSKNYWCSKMDAERVRQNSRPSVYSIPEGIQIKNVLKVFEDTAAVDDVTLEVGENQITVILGHSGAGKTTLMSILAGLLQPTKGSVLLKGNDLLKNDIGWCPQHDILFPNLTCREQLVFYRKVCSPDSRVEEDELYAVLNRLGMTDQAGKLPARITQTESRSLSVACAIFSNAQVVLLDEPSARVDPAARDDLWNLIRNMRRGRTVLMSTHDPYEAEVVGDSVAMLVKGRIKCNGAPSYLQNIYDPGYKLVVATETGDIGIITQVVLSHFPAAVCLGLHNFQVVYRLPDGEMPAMPDLLMELETKKTSLGVTAYELHRTSLRDILFRLSTPVRKVSVKKELEEATMQVSSSSTDFVAGTDYFTVWSISSPARRNARNQRDSVRSLSHSVDGNRKNLSFQPEIPAKKSPTPIHTANVDQLYIAQKESEDFTTEYTRKIEYQRNEGYEYMLQTFVAVFTKKWVVFKRTPLSSMALLVVPPLLIFLAAEVDYLMNPARRDQSLLFSVDDIASSVSLLEVGPGVPESLVDAYKSQFSGTNEVITLAKNSDMVKELNAWAKNRLDRRFVVGAALRESPDVSVGYYHANALHSQGLTVQLMINAYVRFYLGEGYSLQSGVFHRMKQRFVPVLRHGFLALTVVMATLPGVFIHSPIADRAIGAKHLECFTGLSPIAYWTGTFVFDLIVYTTIMILVLGTCWYLPFTLLDGDRWLVTPCLLMTYGGAILPYIYCVQLVFDVPSSGAVGIVLINFTLGILCHVLASYSEDDQNVALLDIVMTIVSPQYALESSLNHLADIKAPDNKDKFVDHRWLVGSGRDDTIPIIKMVCLLCQGALSWVFLMCVEYGLLQKMKYNLGLSYTQMTVEFEPGYGLKDNEDDYDDVLIESDRVDKTHLGLLKKQDVILMRQLQKLYLSDHCRLINGVEPISLGIRLYQCFGLLGQGGTGKTSLFKMLTGDVMISSGSAYIFGYNVRTEFKQILPITGYCPQNNALNDLLTGRETLELYGQLKGIPADKLRKVVGHMLDLVGLRHDMDTLTKFYSKGTKRKLCVAIALIGNPFVVLLDEPTNGMDQASKEAIWNLLKMVKESGRTILLASQSMEEIERLCSRMSIMMRGKLMCLGGPDYLKDKYSLGYTLEIHCSAGDSSQVMLYVRDHLVGAGIFCHLKEYLCFLIPHCIALHQVFVTLQYAQRQIGFTSFTVHRSRLEQVFLMFVKDSTTFTKSSTCL